MPDGWILALSRLYVTCAGQSPFAPAPNSIRRAGRSTLQSHAGLGGNHHGGVGVGLTRCTWSYGTFRHKDVLEYVRYFEFEGETLELVIEFDYDELLEAIEG